jgi:hypothetical protein
MDDLQQGYGIVNDGIVVQRVEGGKRVTGGRPAILMAFSTVDASAGRRQPSDGCSPTQ